MDILASAPIVSSSRPVVSSSRVNRSGWTRHLTAICLALLSLSLPLVMHGQTSPAPIAPRIVTPLNEAEFTTLKANTPPLAQKQFDQGAVPDDTPANRMLLVLKRSPAQETELKRLIEDQQNPSSANFHKWLDTESFGKQFGPADSDISQVTAWLEAKGFTVNAVGRGKQTIDFSGTAGQVRLAFKTELHTYKRGDVVFHANSSDPQIPSAFAPVIAGFASLNDIKPKSNAKVKGTAVLNTKTHAAAPQWNYGQECASFANGTFSTFTCTYYPPTPGDLAVQYNLTPVYKAGTTGGGVSIGVISASNVDLGIVQNYRSLFGFANIGNLPVVIIDGNDPGQNNAATEAYLDVEAASSMAPDATVNLYTSADTLTTSGVINAIARAVNDNTSDILTLSYGECEQFLGSAGNQFFYQSWEQAAAQGQSVFVSAGDAGSAGCDNFDQEGQATLGLAVNGFASTPFNTAVGGTDFYYSQWQEGINGDDLQAQIQAAWGTTLPTTNPTSTLIAPIQEQAWNDGYGDDINTQEFGYSIVAGSGGPSTCVTGTGQDPATGGYTACTAGYPKPSWQAGKGVPTDGVRDIPDVALFAADGANYSFWPICAGLYDCRGDASVPQYSVPVTAVGGTSAATPAMAGIMALVNQTQKGRQGNPNYTLYALAAQYPTSFNDVTVGTNDVVCTQGTPDCSLDTNGDGFYTLQHYSAGAGYDLASGLGSVNVANLVANWSKIVYKSTSTTLSLGSATVAHGTPLSIKVGVTASSTGTPTGSVALVTTSTTPGQTGEGTIALTDGSGTGSIDFLPGGTYNVVGTYSGDGVFAASTSAPASITVTPEASTSAIVAVDYNQNVYPASLTTLTAGSSLSFDDSLILDVTVAGKSGNGAATGQVTFFDGTTNIGTANVSAAGIAELITGALTPGTHSLSATYAGDASFNASTTSSLPIKVTQGASSVYLSYLNSYDSQGNPFIYAGQPFVVSFTVPGGSASVAPTGTVTLNFAGLPPQTVTLAPGFAGVNVGVGYATFAPATPGSYPLTATYTGDANYAPSKGQSYSAIAVVAPTLAPTTTSLTSNATSIGPDGVFRLTAQVTGSISGTTPTGFVNFFFGLLYYQVPVDSMGRATALFGGEALATGTTQVYAAYAGDTHYAQSSSSLIAITANLGDFSLTTSDPDIVMKSGSTGMTTLYVAQIEQAVSSGLTGAVNLTCTPASTAITCSVATPALNLLPNGAQASTTLTINSHVPVTSARNSAPEGFGQRAKTLGGGTVVAMLVLLLPRRRRKVLNLFVLAIAVTLGFGALGCGNTNPPAATPVPSGNAAPGVYQVTVMGNVGGVQHSLLLRVTVQ